MEYQATPKWSLAMEYGIQLRTLMRALEPKMEELCEAGYKKGARYFLPKQVEIIIGFLGKPTYKAPAIKPGLA
jgi:hypothetical protein